MLGRAIARLILFVACNINTCKTMRVLILDIRYTSEMPFFTFKVDDEVVYRTQLESLQCADHTKAGHRCKRRTVIGSPYCSSHLTSIHYLKIKQSTIPGAGKGLFAWDPRHRHGNGTAVLYTRGELICKYRGEVIDREELIDRYGGKTGPYVVGLSANVFEDGAKVRGIGSLANTLPGANNATLSIFRGHASLRATKALRHGDEILLSYGRQYKLNERGVEAYTN